jgi:hypothetical protein
MNIEGTRACHDMVDKLFGKGSIESILLTIAKDIEQGSRREDLCGMLIDCDRSTGQLREDVSLGGSTDQVREFVSGDRYTGQIREVVSREMAEVVLADMREIECLREMLNNASRSIKDCPVDHVPIVCISLDNCGYITAFTALAEVNEHVHRLVRGGDA